MFRDAKNFDDAENRCRQKGAHVVSIHSELENQFVHSQFIKNGNLRNISASRYAIGGRGPYSIAVIRWGGGGSII